MSGNTDFASVSELSGIDATIEQVERHARRYYWAAEYCRAKDILEVACGTGQGVGYLGSVARSITVGDYSATLLEMARRHYGQRFQFRRFDAQQLPFTNDAFDVVLILEALYYIPDVHSFLRECRRVLRPGGTLLIVTANKDLFDFNASPHSTRYFGVAELGEILERQGFETEFFGDTPVGTVSTRQRLLRPVKALASRFGLIPKTMNGKRLLKRLVFGRLVTMPAEITAATARRVPPTPVAAGIPNNEHKVIFCAATLRK